MAVSVCHEPRRSEKDDVRGGSSEIRGYEEEAATDFEKTCNADTVSFRSYVTDAKKALDAERERTGETDPARLQQNMQAAEQARRDGF